MYWFVTTIFIIFSFSKLTEANKLGKKLPSAVIVGTVYCDTCFQAELSKPSHFIAGALVGVECKGARSDRSFQKQVKTNANGEFRVRLPFSVSKHVNQIKNCSVKLIKSNEPYCAIASSATQSSLNLKTKNKKTHIFSAGYFTFKPQNQPNLCNQKPSENFNSRKFLLLIDPNTVVQNPIIPNLPLTDQNPIIPNLPSIGQNPVIPNLPSTGLSPIISNLPPTGQNTIIPNLPSTGPSLLPPLPPLPRLPPLPPLPGLPLFPPSDKNSLKPKTKDALKDNVSKRENALGKKKMSNHEAPRTKNAFEKPGLPNHKVLKPENELEKSKMPNHTVPNTKNTLEKTEMLNLEVEKDQVLPSNPQLPVFSSPPPVFGFQFPPFSFRQPSTNFPTNPFQMSPPSVNFPTIPNLNSPPVVQPLPSPPVLTNPNLPPFPFQPSPGFPGFPPAREKKSP